MKQNRIKEILYSKGIVRPTDETIAKLGIDKTRFYNILACRVKLKELEPFKFAEWLEVEVKELYEKKSQLTNKIAA